MTPAREIKSCIHLHSFIHFHSVFPVQPKCLVHPGFWVHPVFLAQLVFLLVHFVSGPCNIPSSPDIPGPSSVLRPFSGAGPSTSSAPTVPGPSIAVQPRIHRPVQIGVPSPSYVTNPEIIPLFNNYLCQLMNSFQPMSTLLSSPVQ